MSILKRILCSKILISFFCSLLFIYFILLQPTSLVIPSVAITPHETRLARNVVKQVASKLSSKKSFIEINIKQNELAAMAKMGSHVLPKTHMVLATSNLGISVALSTEVSFPFTRYLNLRCLVLQTSSSAELHDCSMGYLPIPDGLIEWIGLTGVSLVMGDDFSDTAKELLASVEYSNKGIKLQAQKSKFLKEQVNASMSKLGDLASIYQQNASVDKAVIQRYLDELDKVTSKELAPYIGKLFSLAKNDSATSNPVEENTAIIWALAIKFGDYHFASLMGLKSNKKNSSIPSTRGRIDLTQHFIYSAVLHQLGDLDIGLALGEAKELLDSLAGGSGFSFSDLAADKAGLHFADFITSNRSNALKAQKLLANISTEDSYFPFIHDLPDGFRDVDYQRVISSIGSKNYLYVEGEIDKRITLLALNKRKLAEKQGSKSHEKWREANNTNNTKAWYKVDTHIHSKFSDGSYSINDIAEKANQYGCDAIAITDHGDHNLLKVLSDEYFNAIYDAQHKYTNMTVMAGLEWNIPPFRGREHATVILPDTFHQQRNLTVFRDRFDQNKRYDDKVLSPESAFKWLNKYGNDESSIKPLVLYNHPSRKDAQQRENEHDFAYWRQFSDLMIGFSGAPGHQKAKGLKNGAYGKHLKTINGWDPAIDNVGGEWDRLLQKGYKIWAARAPSDFHNIKSDYWPCQFSSTHVLSKSNSQNDILNAFQSGDYWAQHGSFIKELEFNVLSNNTHVAMGSYKPVRRDEIVDVNIAVELNHFDWQSEPTNLDELELIIITENKVTSVPLNVFKRNANKVIVSYPYVVSSEFVIFRLRGKNNRADKRSYMFYSNPIKLTTY